MARKKKSSKEDANLFSITLQMGDIAFHGKGATAYEALENLEQPKKPIFLKTVVTLERNGKSHTYPLIPSKARRFYMRMARPFLAKNLEILV